MELNGDEADGSLGEDDFHSSSANWLALPGCPLADPGGQCDEDGINTGLIHGKGVGAGCRISDDDYEGEVI